MELLFAQLAALIPPPYFNGKGVWKPQLENIAVTDSELLVTVLGRANVLFRGLVDKI